MDIILFMLFMWGLYKIAVFIWNQIISIKNSIIKELFVENEISRTPHSPKKTQSKEFATHIIGTIYLN